MSAGRRQSAHDILRSREKNWPAAVTPIAHLTVRIFRFSNLILDNAARQVAARSPNGPWRTCCGRTRS